MSLCIVVIVTLFIGLSNGQNSYYIPEPKINVLSANHFQISIDDNAGITFVAFHVNINEDIRAQQIGQISKEIFHPHHGKWTFDVTNVELNAGDKIHYWVFVIQDHMGYQKVGTYSVRDQGSWTSEVSDPHPIQSSSAQSHHQPENCVGCASGGIDTKLTSTTSAPSLPEANQDFSLNACNNFLLNITQNLITLQYELEDMRKRNQQLTDLLERYPDAKTLTLTAKIPLNSDPALTVRFIIRDKLNLNPDIVTANKISEDSIEFKVATVAEKVEILEAARTELVDSKISIS